MARDTCTPTQTAPGAPAHRQERAGPGPTCAMWGGCLGSVGFMVIVITLLAMSFSYVNYYEVGLRQQRSTAAVFLDRVYGPGRYFVGPDMEFRKFSTDAYLVEYPALDIFTSDKLDTFIDIYYIYFLKLDELAALKQAYDLNYDQVIQNEGMAAIKNAATHFSTEAYFQNRTAVEDALFGALQARLSQMHVRVPQMFLGHVSIPDAVAEKQLTSAIQFETNKQQVFESQAQLIRKTTDAMVNEINNNATIIAQTAYSQADLIAKTAQAVALATVSGARNSGLELLYAALGVSSPGQKARLDFVQSLINNGNASLHVGYQTKLLTS